MIKFNKSTKIFSSTKYKDGCWSDDTSIISCYDTIKNYICNLNQPFTANKIINELVLNKVRHEDIYLKCSQKVTLN